MTETADHPSVALLRRLSTLHDMSTPELQALSERLYVHVAPQGHELLAIGATETSTLYLLEGTCKLVAEDGGKTTVHHTDPSAHAPLARLRPSRYRVVAAGPVRYLRIDDGLVAQTESHFEQASTLSLETYQVEEEYDDGALAAENQLTLQIYEDLNTGRLLLPSLPSVAVRIGDAVNDEASSAAKVAKLIETDPAIAVKVLKAANSARFGGVAEIGTVSDAVARLGMKNIQVLVVTFALRELFRTDSAPLAKRMVKLWEHSRRIAALSQVLGNKVGSFNPHEALLAGLIHDIGSLAVIGYARDVPEVAENPEALESSIQSLRSQLGGMILSKWQLPPVLMVAAKEAENWYREQEGEADFADLVIVAQLHEGVGGDIDPSRVPALGRLGLAPSEIDRGLELLHDAHEEVAAAKRLLAG
jgi:HD-like signal output (HDOD) protein